MGTQEGRMKGGRVSESRRDQKAVKVRLFAEERLVIDTAAQALGESREEFMRKAAGLRTRLVLGKGGE